MFEIGLEWWRGLGQIAIYCAVIVSILWVMSKIKIKEKGEDNE
jgi:hypothetical protein